jgi:hypothetical protein
MPADGTPPVYQLGRPRATGSAPLYSVRMPVRRVFLLSPAHCGGERAGLVLRDQARFDLAERLRRPGGAPIGEVFAFLSGLYFRGKLAYATAFAQPPPGVPGVLVITPSRGLLLPDQPVVIDTLREFASVDIDSADGRYREPLERDARLLVAHLPARCEVVLLGSIATTKYVEVLDATLDGRLRFPSAFVGRGDMSRGGLLLRCARERRELEYVPLDGAVRRGPRPPRLGAPR